MMNQNEKLRLARKLSEARDWKEGAREVYEKREKRKRK